MILYVNGDSHSAGAEAANNFCFGYDDPKYQHLGRKPHPDNLKVSYGQQLADLLSYQLTCDAESGSSNQRILNTTYKYLENHRPNLVIIGWATWEREEVWVDGEPHQFSAGLILDCWPPVSQAVKDRYKEWVLTRQDVNVYCDQQQQEIHKLHEFLRSKSIPHIFFNTFSALVDVDHLEWHNSYVGPYDHSQSYFNLLKSWGYQTVKQGNYHYPATAHTAWAEYLKNWLTTNFKESIITT